MTRALLIGRAPAEDLGFEYVAEGTYDAVVIGSLTLGQLLRFREEAVEKILQSAMENVGYFLKIGGKIAPGTDAGAWAVPHGSLTEYELLEEILGEKTQEILEEGIRAVQEKF